MADFGIGETIAAVGAEGAAKGAETAGAAAGADLLAPALVEGGTDVLAGLGPAATTLTVNALPGAAEAATAGGLDFGGILGGAGSALGAAGSAIGSALGPSGAVAAEAPIAASGAGSLTSPGTPQAGPGVLSNADLVDPISAVGQGGFPIPQGTGAGASAFTPAPGVQLPSGVTPDATSAAAFKDPSFADRALPAEQAGQTGVFSGFETPDSPVGSAIGATDFSAAPPGATGTTFPAAGTPTASPNLGDFVTPAGGTPSPTAAGGVTASGGLDSSGNPIDPLTGSSNPQYPGGGVATLYDPAGATVGTGATTPAAGGDTSILGKVGQGALDSVTKNPLGIGLGAAGLGLNLLNAKKESQALKNLQAQATKQSSTADQLANYALTGTVPPGSQAGIDQAIAEAKANAISNAAGQGLPTDPTKNTALAATLAKIDSQGPILAAQIGQQLLSAGANFAGLSGPLYTQLAQIDQSQRASMGKAIANFAAALNTGGGAKIQIGGTS